MTHSKADELLALMVERAEEVNRDPQFIYRVSRLTVFGSYLTDKEKLGDLDVAVELLPKHNAEKHSKLIKQQSINEATGDWWEQSVWSRRKVHRALKRQNHAFSLHDYANFVLMVEQGGAVGREFYRSK